MFSSLHHITSLTTHAYSMAMYMHKKGIKGQLVVLLLIGGYNFKILNYKIKIKNLKKNDRFPKYGSKKKRYR